MDRSLTSTAQNSDPAPPDVSSLAAPTVAAPTLPYLQIAWFLGLVVVLFFPVLVPMVNEWTGDSDMGHAFFVPVVAGYIVWKERERIMAEPLKPCWPAAVFIVWGFFQMVLGFLGADFFVSRTAFIVMIVGVIWTIAGTAVVRALSFPLFLLVFMIRLPLFTYQQLTFQLQLLASQLATAILGVLSIPVLRDGNILELPSRRLEVIEACSGIRSLLSLSFLSLAYSYMADHRAWMRPVLFVLTIPIAIAVNALRVTITGILSELKPELTEGVFHAMEGWVMFALAFAALFMVHRLICRFAGASHV